MKLAALIGILIVTLLFTLYTWPKLNKDQRKEKRAFIVLTVMAVFLAVTLLYFPKLPGPTELIDWIFRPLGKVLKM